jgi:hypothetical protein
MNHRRVPITTTRTASTSSGSGVGLFDPGMSAA